MKIWMAKDESGKTTPSTWEYKGIMSVSGTSTEMGMTTLSRVCTQKIVWQSIWPEPNVIRRTPMIDRRKNHAVTPVRNGTEPPVGPVLVAPTDKAKEEQPAVFHAPLRDVLCPVSRWFPPHVPKSCYHAVLMCKKRLLLVFARSTR